MTLRIGDTGGDHEVLVDDPAGETWSGEVLSDLAPASSWAPGEVSVLVVGGAGLDGSRARARVTVVDGRIHLEGLEPFAVTDQGNSLWTFGAPRSTPGENHGLRAGRRKGACM